MTTILGLLLGLFSGIMTGSFSLPMKKTTRWSWEATWLIWSVCALLIIPWAIAFVTVPDVLDIFTGAKVSDMLRVFVFGACWGLGAVFFGQSIAMIGISLSFALCIGLATALGQLIPMLQDPQLFQTPGGIWATIGIAVMVVGVAVCAVAGHFKEKQMKAAAGDRPQTQEPASKPAGGMMLGLVLATLGGIFSSMLNLAFNFSGSIKDAALALGASDVSKSDPVWAITLLGGLAVNVVYCSFLLFRNKTWGDYKKTQTRSYWPLAAIMGAIWMPSVALYGRAAVLMGDLGSSAGWGLYMGVVILVSNFWGLVTGEWRGIRGKPIKLIVIGIALLLAAICIIGYATTLKTTGTPDPPGSDYNVVWDSPSKDYNGTMPIGNGDIGANVWVEDGGDLLFYISKTDAWSENARLLKLGKIRVRLTPNPFEKGCSFSQQLDLKDGVIKISSAASPETSVDLKFWIDANNPAVRVTGNTVKDTTVEVILEHWRTQRKEAANGDRSFTGLFDRDSKGGGFAYPLFIEPDTIVDRKDNTILWYHRNKKNEHSVWQDTLKVQGLDEYMDKSTDPLLNLTFGALVKAENMVTTSPAILKSSAPTKNINVTIFPLTAQTATADEWIEKVEAQAEKYKSQSPESLWTEHKKWWNQFWDRSYINIDAGPEDDAYIVARGYALQNWITACGGRGSMPIKFNGSIFTVDGTQRYNGMYLGPDYRAWGPCYWWQNTRLPYWPMFAAGNYDIMKPLFKMYTDALPLQQQKIKKYYNFDGACFPETMYFWGTHANQDYGWNPEKDRHPDLIRGFHIRYEWQGGIELTAMMLQYYHHTLDKEFLNTTVLPFAKEIVAFYDNRYERNEEGKLVIFPANALEDVWHCTNPTPEVAGLKFILPQLIELTSDTGQKKNYIRFLNEIPELETDISEDGKKYILPARKDVKRRGNCEKPECYAIFPYRLYGVGLPDLEIAKETFRLSPRTMNGQDRTNGWAQDPIFAASLGNVDEARDTLVKRSKQFHTESRFPAFWGPNFDWIPDQDHGGVNMIALQHMLLQTEPYSDKIHLCPAWPKEWNCSFKLHAPGNTTVQGKVKDGKVVDLKVTPKSRMKDIVNYMNPEK